MINSIKQGIMIWKALIAIVLSLALIPTFAFADVLDDEQSLMPPTAETSDISEDVEWPDAEPADPSDVAAEEVSAIESEAIDGEASDEGRQREIDPFADVPPADFDSDFVENELIIVYEGQMIEQQETLEIEDIDAEVKLEDLGVVEQEELVDDSETNASGAVVLAKVDDGSSVEEVAAKLEQIPGVAYVQPNYIYTASTTTTNDTKASGQYYLTSSKVFDAWDYKKTSRSVTVAVIDSGCKLDHPDLEKNILTDLAWDCQSDDKLVNQMSNIGHGGDSYGHGTMVCGIIAAEANNGFGIAGVSYNAKLLPIRVMNNNGEATTGNLIKALQKIDEYKNKGLVPDLKIVNMSLGGYKDDEQTHSWIKRLRNVHGMTIVCAGGNGDSNNNPITAPCYPSDYDECIGVTSLTRSGAHSYWSDYNPSKDISAPGEGILVTTNDGGYADTMRTASGKLVSISGTSFSAPIVSGVTALILAACPDATPVDVRNALRESATAISGAARPYNGSAGAVNAIGALAYMGVDTSATYNWVPSYESSYSPVYSYAYYRAKFADLKNAFGYNRRSFVSHFVNHGMAEGRQAKASFEVASYYNANPDLRRAFGRDLKAYCVHYVTNGRFEGRKATGAPSLQGFASSYAGTNWSPVYDGQYYYSKYADLRSAFIVRAPFAAVYDDMALLAHFVGNGMAEGRQAKASFEVASYYNANPDLRRAFGRDLKAYCVHYVTNGRFEGRKATGAPSLQGFASSYAGTNWSPVYDGQYYYSKYADLRSAFIVRAPFAAVYDDMALLAHFVNHGMAEGRQAKASFDVQAYRASYPDLRAAFGRDLKAYCVHYVTNGRFEGRKAA